MKLFTTYILLVLAITIAACSNERYKPVLKTDANGYQYEEVTNDPAKTRLYTLENGLKIYLSVNRDEPRINTLIAVRAGSINDPKETTGLAHYFEHLLFKGTDDYGTLNWDAEKILIDSISDLFELHRKAINQEEKNRIYEQIDKVSYEASKLAVPNEYDRMLGALGANGTNAGTSFEYTTYMNEIPSNEVDRWLELEFERFSDPVLRLFHTELETVYEEFNLAQDRDDRRLYNAMFQSVFQKHPLGKSILGTQQDLKNPSMKNIVKFFQTWYVPNNMAIIMSGDMDPAEVIKKVDATFGTKASRTVPEVTHPKEDPITQPSIKTIYGPDMEMFNMVFRFNGRNSDDRVLVTMIDMLLNNTVAGLIDLNLVQKQKVLYAGCTPTFFNDYGMHFFYGVPREGQSLEETRQLVLAEINKIKKGEFETWLMKAVVNDLRLLKMSQFESSKKNHIYLQSFVSGSSLADELLFLDKMDQLSKSEVISFARENYRENYVVVNKIKGTPKNIIKLDKPNITPVQINRDVQSEYVKNFLSREREVLEPEFVDFDKAIVKEQVANGLELKYIKNEANDLFDLMYITPIGENHDPELALAMKYLPYLGTKVYTAEKIREEFYKLGISLKTGVKDDISIISISGLERNLHAGLELLEHLMNNAEADSTAYANLVEGILKERDNMKKSPKAIKEAMLNYGKYGENSSFRNVLSEEQLLKTDPEKLVERIRNLSKFKHTAFYYGSKSAYNVKSLIKSVHKMPDEMQPIPEERRYETLDFNRPRVLFLDYPKSQVDILFLAKDQVFDLETLITSSVFNEYYGTSMSSVIFQEIREAKALAYYSWASFISPQKAGEEFFLYGNLTTQSDKMQDAIQSMSDLLSNMVVSENAFKAATENVIKNIQSERIVKQDIFWTCVKNKKLGLNFDYRKNQYEAAKSLNIKDMQAFFDQHIKNKNYTYMVLGNKEDIDFSELEKIAEIEELKLEQIFKY